ncbi:hypothetical protein KUTeg_005363 [Tegillarca granosa]|uniref:Uncharacterized protein n=1 Tax=Tegillarca granosa TaxID=220873 RepID=A0ABQ9FJJ5_TEGGR|nr:hypothetical protein KUTeg_005363 [Tegillarca granosa]
MLAARAVCRCSGRCGTFRCSNPNNTRGCDCVNCRCIPGSIGVKDVVRVVVVFGTERSVLDVKYGKHAIVMAVGVKDITLLDVSDLRDVDVATTSTPVSDNVNIINNIKQRIIYDTRATSTPVSDNVNIINNIKQHIIDDTRATSTPVSDNVNIINNIKQHLIDDTTATSTPVSDNVNIINNIKQHIIDDTRATLTPVSDNVNIINNII